jgi:hypothetical protein
MSTLGGGSLQTQWMEKPPYRGDPKWQPLRASFRPDDLQALMEANGIDGAVLVEAVDDLKETEALLTTAREKRLGDGCRGLAALADAPALEAALDKVGDVAALVGIRHLINTEPDPDWFFARRCRRRSEPDRPSRSQLRLCRHLHGPPRTGAAPSPMPVPSSQSFSIISTTRRLPEALVAKRFIAAGRKGIALQRLQRSWRDERRSALGDHPRPGRAHAFAGEKSPTLRTWRTSSPASWGRGDPRRSSFRRTPSRSPTSTYRVRPRAFRA